MVIMMNKNILISICLLLISMVGVGCVSAADTNATDINDMGQMTVDQQVAPNDGANKQANSNAFVVVPKEVTDREHSFEKHQIKNDTKEVTVVNSTQNNTINNTNKNNNTDANKPKLDIKGPKPSAPLNIKGPNMPYKIIKKSKTFECNGKKMFIAQIQNGTERKTVCFQMSTSASSYVEKTGMDLLNLLDSEGVLKKMSYGFSWLGVKITNLFTGEYDNLPPEAEELMIKYLAWGKDQSKWAW